MGARHSFWLGILLLLSPAALAHQEIHPRSLFPVGRENVRVLLGSSVVLMPNATALTENTQRIEVAVSGVRSPLPLDMVALYAPASADPTRTVPTLWATIAQTNPDYVRTGAGRVVFTVLNHRADFIFRLLRNGTNLPGQQPIVVEGASPVVRNTIAARPTQGHLGLDDRGRYVVQWVSGARDGQQVAWGASPSALTNSAPSTAVTYTASQMCGSPANSTGWLDPGYLHHAVLPDAPAPGQRVHYRFGSQAAGWSEVFSFTGPPPPGGPTRFLVFNDVGMTQPVLFNSICPPWCPGGFNWAVGYAANASKLVPYLEKETADVALLIGDVSYAQGYAAEWDSFGALFERAFTRWPLMVATGNHERDYPGTGDAFEDQSLDSGGECNVPFTYRYYTPASYPRLDPRVSFYSFNMGAVHFLILDSESPTAPGSPQHDFAVSDLGRVDRARTPWVVVGFHRMMYAPSTDERPVVGDGPVMRRLRADFEGLFASAGVTLVISGHEHAYARTCPLLEGKCVKSGGITYILTGNAGAGFTHNFPLRAGGGYAFEDWVAYGVQDKNGYLRVSTTPGGALLMEAVSTDDGRVFDSATIGEPPTPARSFPSATPPKRAPPSSAQPPKRAPSSSHSTQTQKRAPSSPSAPPKRAAPPPAAGAGSGWQGALLAPMRAAVRFIFGES